MEKGMLCEDRDKNREILCDNRGRDRSAESTGQRMPWISRKDWKPGRGQGKVPPLRASKKELTLLTC